MLSNEKFAHTFGSGLPPGSSNCTGTGRDAGGNEVN